MFWVSGVWGVTRVIWAVEGLGFEACSYLTWRGHAPLRLPKSRYSNLLYLYGKRTGFGLLGSIRSPLICSITHARWGALNSTYTHNSRRPRRVQSSEMYRVSITMAWGMQSVFGSLWGSGALPLSYIPVEPRREGRSLPIQPE